MTNKNQTSTRFRDEIGIIPRWIFFFATFVGLACAVAFVIMVGRGHNPPPAAARPLLGIIMATMLACYVLLIGYINQDAGRRNMSRLLWTLMAMFVPNGLGIVLYFVLRKPRTAHCPQCSAEVEPGYSFCPRCRNRLLPVCPHCQRGVDLADKFCPYCGETMEPAPAVPVTTNQP